ncbi:MAG: fluoride efflux transporter CrcB [Gammaproteobacteria bacterium]|nr:fluoride efflux transporter CrcB [Gammaproteobacteria bacterium]
MSWLLVALGGALGAVSRYGIGRVLLVYPGFPFATLVVNVTGSFFIGYLAALFLQRPGSDDLRLLLVTGFLGAFTTFSAFSLETLMLYQQGEPFRAALNILLSLVLCLGAVSAGFLLARQFLS